VQAPGSTAERHAFSMLRRRSLSWETDITATVANVTGGQRTMTLWHAAPFSADQIAESMELPGSIVVDQICEITTNDVTGGFDE
jgi:hypothetical protein